MPTTTRCALIFALCSFLLSFSPPASLQVFASPPTWGEGEQVPAEGRSNILNLNSAEFENFRAEGRLHSLWYPVSVTGLLFPYQPLLNLLDKETKERDPFRWILRKIGGGFLGMRSLEDFQDKVGVLDYPLPPASGSGIYDIPRPEGLQDRMRMGMTLIERKGATGLTFSCAACHAGELFGKKVLGLSNRFPKANEFFVLGKQLSKQLDPLVFRLATKASSEETQMYKDLRNSIQYIGAKTPLVQGLDTSVAQVGLSLSTRAQDADATRDPSFLKNPAPNLLNDQPADSKPAVWWNLKYKNKWLSDGSVVSGNPILTNILWNEIGRGAELNEVSTWIQDNSKAIDELTVATFASEAPSYFDFFPAAGFDAEKAMRGEKLFNQHCAKCHGSYQKGWSEMGAEAPLRDRLKTLQVRYHSDTPVVDVGTDAFRRSGMKGVAAQLNRLDVSQKNGILVKVQPGYVPPPLVGIWARWPYFHNNSAPSLCAVLTKAADRPKTYHAGEALNPQTDFDKDCVGYPLGNKTPEAWKRESGAAKERFFDSSRKGLGNQGHDEGIFLQDGKEMLTQDQKAEIIQFLKTL